MKSPVYKYPNFVQQVELEVSDGKRYWLDLTIDKNKTDSIAVILKNPSRADKVYSDKTVYTVCNYIYRNRERHEALGNIGTITIMNLIPHYLTDSGKLYEFKEDIIDQKNIQYLGEVCKRCSKVIIAWGNHPTRLYPEYETLKETVRQLFVEHNNEVYYVHRMTADGNPMHAQVWGYDYMLIGPTKNGQRFQ